MDVATLEDGTFILVWNDHGGIFGKIFDQFGQPKTESFLVSIDRGDQNLPSVANISEDHFIITWMSEPNGAEGDVDDDGSDRGIFGQIIDSLGNLKGEKLNINQYTENSQGFGSVANLSEGGFFVVWDSYVGDHEPVSGISGRLFDENGAPKTDEFRISNETSFWSVHAPIVSQLENGKLVVVWRTEEFDGGEGQIFAKIYDELGQAASEKFQVSEELSSAEIWGPSEFWGHTFSITPLIK